MKIKSIALIICVIAAFTFVACLENTADTSPSSEVLPSTSEQPLNSGDNNITYVDLSNVEIIDNSISLPQEYCRFSDFTDMKYNLFLDVVFSYHEVGGAMTVYEGCVLDKNTSTYEQGVKNYSELLYNITGENYLDFLQGYTGSTLNERKREWSFCHENIFAISLTSNQVFTTLYSSEFTQKRYFDVVEKICMYTDNTLSNTWSDLEINPHGDCFLELTTTANNQKYCTVKSFSIQDEIKVPLVADISQLTKNAVATHFLGIAFDKQDNQQEIWVYPIQENPQQIICYLLPKGIIAQYKYFVGDENNGLIIFTTADGKVYLLKNSTHEISYLGNNMWGNLIISPDGRYLVYQSYDDLAMQLEPNKIFPMMERGVYVRDLQTDNVAKIEIEAKTDYFSAFFGYWYK